MVEHREVYDQPEFPVLLGNEENSGIISGLSTGRFDPDRGDLFCNSMPKEGSPGGGFRPKGVASKSVAEA